MRSRFVFIFLLFSSTLLAYNNIPYGYPSTNGIVLTRQGYILLYDKRTKDPVWVYENITAQHINHPVTVRKDDFQPDPNLQPGQRAELIDYKGSKKYDRGHMAPSADMLWSTNAQRESFYLSNMCPQFFSLNRGLWSSLEDKVRNLATNKSQIWVFTGPVYEDINHDGKPDDLGKLGKDKIAIPTHFYKIVIYSNNNALQGVAFIIPNKKPVQKLKAFITTIDEVETQTGLNFLNKLPSSLEKKVEAQIPQNISYWTK